MINRGFKLCLFVMLIFSTINVLAQEETVFSKLSKHSLGQGEVVIHQSKVLEEMITNFAARNKVSSKVEGYRIQLFSGTGASAKKQSQEVKTKMLDYFPYESVSVEYNAPFWRVRTGAFRHKHEALPLLRKIKSSFPNCYVVKDNGIRLSELK